MKERSVYGIAFEVAQLLAVMVKCFVTASSIPRNAACKCCEEWWHPVSPDRFGCEFEPECFIYANDFR